LLIESDPSGITVWIVLLFGGKGRSFSPSVLISALGFTGTTGGRKESTASLLIFAIIIIGFSISFL